jgi:hypothetical protein
MDNPCSYTCVIKNLAVFRSFVLVCARLCVELGVLDTSYKLLVPNIHGCLRLLLLWDTIHSGNAYYYYTSLLSQKVSEID